MPYGYIIDSMLNLRNTPIRPSKHESSAFLRLQQPLTHALDVHHLFRCMRGQVERSVLCKRNIILQAVPISTERNNTKL